MWANLVANAADPQAVVPVFPSFTDILRHLSRSEALFLEAVYSVMLSELTIQCKAFPEEHWPSFLQTKTVQHDHLLNIFCRAGLSKQPATILMSRRYGIERAEDWNAFRIVVDTLLRQNLINCSPKLKEHAPEVIAKKPEVFVIEYAYTLTTLGFAFIKSCKAPMPRP